MPSHHVAVAEKLVYQQRCVLSCAAGSISLQHPEYATLAFAADHEFMTRKDSFLSMWKPYGDER